MATETKTATVATSKSVGVEFWLLCKNGTPCKGKDGKTGPCFATRSAGQAQLRLLAGNPACDIKEDTPAGDRIVGLQHFALKRMTIE